MAIFPAMSTTVNVAEFKNRLSEFLEMVENGTEVIVCRRNVPLAKIVPIRKPNLSQRVLDSLGCMSGTVTIHDDLTAPAIPEDDWEMLR